jgi:hypothetical protein
MSKIGDALLNERNITGFDITTATTADLCSRTEEEEVRRLWTTEDNPQHRQLKYALKLTDQADSA